MKRILHEIVKKNHAWNIRRLVDESFVLASQQTSLLYWRLTDFCSVVCLAETGLRAIWAEQHAMYTRFLSDQDGIYCTKAKEWLGYYCPDIYCGLHHPGGGCSCILLLLHLDFYRYTHLPHSHTYVGRPETRRWRRRGGGKVMWHMICVGTVSMW